jgi:hypothetical protein
MQGMHHSKGGWLCMRRKWLHEWTVQCAQARTLHRLHQPAAAPAASALPQLYRL